MADAGEGYTTDIFYPLSTEFNLTDIFSRKIQTESRLGLPPSLSGCLTRACLEWPRRGLGAMLPLAMNDCLNKLRSRWMELWMSLIHSHQKRRFLVSLLIEKATYVM